MVSEKRQLEGVVLLTALIIFIIGLVALSAGGLPEISLDCTSYETSSSHVQLVGSWPFGCSSAVDVESSRNLCFLGSGGGVYVLDISSPASPRKTGEIKTSGVVDALFYDNSSELLYIAAQKGGLEIWDVSHPASPRKIGTYATDHASGVFVSGCYAYVIDTLSSHAGLKVVDVSNPASAQQVGSCAMPDGGLEFYPCSYGGVFVAGAYAYVADGSAGLQVVDVSDFGNLHVVGSCDTPGFAFRVFITGSYAYLGGSQVGLQVIDVSDPFNPYVLGVCDEPDYTQGISVVGDYAYVSDWLYGLHVIDVTNPANPHELSSCYTAGRAYTEVCTDVVVSGSYAYVADGDAGLRVVNISNPTDPYEIGSFDTPGCGRSVVVSDSLAYLSATGLRILDISDPEVPHEVGAFDYTNLSTPQHSHDVFVSGPYAYIGGYPGLQVLDISNPTNPSELASCNTECDVFSVFVSGSYAYLGAIEGDIQGLHIIDISNPRDPREVGSFIVPISWPNYISDVFVTGGHAYLAASEGGLRVIDVSNSTNPHEVGCCETLSSANGVFVSGSYAYVADNNGLCVIDVSKPGQPHEVGCYDTSAYARDVSVSGSYAYVAGSCGLRIFDISNPTHAYEVGSSDTPASVDHVFVSGSYAYVVSAFAGLQIYEFLGQSGDNRPTANAGPDQTTVVGDSVQLDGSGSSDPDDDPLTYAWEIVSSPGGSTATLLNPDTVDPAFTPDVAGQYIAKLTVDDGNGESDSDTVLVTASEDTPAVFRVEGSTGNVYSDGAYYGESFQTGSADVAEWVSVSEPVEPGDVLELDPYNPGFYRKSQTTCSSLVAGVVSTDPGFVLGAEVQDSGVSGPTPDSRLRSPDSALLALIGIVPVKVTDEGGTIQPGDLLVSSSTPGYAMRWDQETDSPCSLVGKALEALTGKSGIILVLLTAH